LLRLNMAEIDAGFELRVASSYRSFERQLLIWNNKASGLRPVLDDRGLPLDISRLSERDLVYAILRWSALPGASRHHWGTDLDVYDASRIAADYQVQLTQAETIGDGPFAEFHRWLDVKLAVQEFSFYRPYEKDRGGIAPEPWHLSYAPIAKRYAAALTVDVLRQQLEQTDIQLKSCILDNLDDIYHRFVRVDSDHPQAD
jgi:LAS superfamily LD-carboxypeptidase LdcB